MGARAEGRGSPRGTHSNDADIHTFIKCLFICQAVARHWGNFLTPRLKFCEEKLISKKKNWGKYHKIRKLGIMGKNGKGHLLSWRLSERAL